VTVDDNVELVKVCSVTRSCQMTCRLLRPEMITIEVFRQLISDVADRLIDTHLLPVFARDADDDDDDGEHSDDDDVKLI